MRKRPGCFKSGCFGCLGVLVLLILIAGINLLVAWTRLGNEEIREREMTPTVDLEAPHLPSASSDAALPGSEATTRSAGRVLLDLSQGAFEIHPAQPGEGLLVRATYDESMYELQETLTAPPDSTWTYEVRFHRTMPWMEALFRQVLGHGEDPTVHIYLPTEVPIELGVVVNEGGVEAQLGGLWLTEAEILFQKGGFSLDFDQPLREPMRRLKIRGGMGGFEADHLGNASPGRMDVYCRMGGAEVDLRGDWRNDCDLDLGVRLGGMSVLVPDGVRVEGVPAFEQEPLAKTPEVSVPVLRLRITQEMGEIEVIR